MRAIGFRAEKNSLHFAVIDESTDPPECDTDKLKIQGGKPTAKELALLRTEVLNLIETHSPDVIGVRTSDKPQSMRYAQSLFERARIEGVVMEASASKGISVVAGPSATIKSGMKTKTKLSDYSDVDEIRGIDLTGKRNASLRDAVYAALAALGKE